MSPTIVKRTCLPRAFLTIMLFIRNHEPPPLFPTDPPPSFPLNQMVHSQFCLATSLYLR